MTNTSLLKRAVESSGLKYKAIAATLGLSTYGLQRKIENVTEFKASEISKLSELLGLSERRRSEIFFAQESDLKSSIKKE